MSCGARRSAPPRASSAGSYVVAKNLLRRPLKVDRMVGFELAQAPGQGPEVARQGQVLAGEDNQVFALVGFDGDDLPGEGVLD